MWDVKASLTFTSLNMVLLWQLFYVFKFWDYFVARAYIVHVYVKRTCINAYLTMTRPKELRKVLLLHCVQRGLLIFNINIGGM